jgi:hypothetical protein
MHGKLLLIALAVASYHIRSCAPVYPDCGDRSIDETTSIGMAIFATQAKIGITGTARAVANAKFPITLIV